jgi:LuxR family transcriptional regulator, maltose regulon positive regulatory protein
LWLMQGNVAAATHWANSSGLRPEGHVSYRQELEYLVLARVLSAARQPAVLTLLDRMLQDAEAQGRTGSMIEILILRALAAQAFRDPMGALAVLERALVLAEPEGYVRVFADEGDPIASLLHSAQVRGIAPDYCNRLLNVLQGRPPGRGGQAAPRRSEPRPLSLVEPLTERERDILRLLVTGASNEQIAKKLWVATGTVKWHVHQILGKLAVRNRTEAVARAKSLSLD